MRIQNSLLILTLLTGSAFAAAQSSTELTNQAKKEFLAVDRELEQYVAQISSTMTPREAEKLQRAQSAWVEYRATCADSEAALASTNSKHALVTFTTMRNLTAERLQRLKALTAAAQQTAPVIAEPPARTYATTMDEVLTSPAVGADEVAMRELFRGQGAANAYLDVMIPKGNALTELLAVQGFNPSYLKWVTEHPEAGRQLVRIAIAEELRARVRNEKQAYRESSLVMATRIIQETRGAGVTLEKVGRVASDFPVTPLPPYEFFVYLTQQNGMRKLTEAYIASKLAAATGS